MRFASARALLVLATLALLAGGVLLYAREAILDPNEFADRATATLEDDDVRHVVSTRIVDEAIEQGSAELIQAQPLLEAAVGAALDTGAFQAVFKQAARNVHTLLFERDRGSIVLDLADAGIVVVSALKAIAPKVADQVPRQVEGALIDLSDRQFATSALDIASSVRFLGIALPILAIVLFIASFVVAEDRRRHVVYGGVAIGIAGGVVVIGLLVAKAIVLGNVADDDSRDAATAAWDSFFGDLRVLALGIGALGLVFAATAASVIAPDEVEDWVDRLRRVLTTQPQSRAWRLGRGLAVIGLSLFVILKPTYAVQVAVVIAGGYGLFFGIGEVLHVVAPPRKGGLGSRDIDLDLDLDIDLPRISPRAIVLATIVTVGIAATVISIAGEDELPPPVERPDRPVTVCNGHEELCGRRLNEVVFAATHNSMAAASEPGWYFPAHRQGIRAQLDYGVRALLIDSHYGIRDKKGNVRTDLEKEGTSRQKIEKALGKEALAAAERLVGRVGFGDLEGKSDTYLCHTVCELGATPLVDGLRDVRSFLDHNPDEFVILFIQDAITPRDTEKAFDQAGLTRYAYAHSRDDVWPTMRELIASDKRMLVMAEGDVKNGPPWYHTGFDLTQETPYVFHSLDELDSPAACRRNRGSDNNPLFQINHWIERVNPSPSLAAKVNAFELMIRRARRCRDERSLLPNILAVDFYDEGELLEVVNVLNRLPRR
jgi:hypothetical protein